jgi:flagellar motility protein MotE (MotC chaperone)
VTHENCTLNYFNYFTEIEEHFQRARGTSLFLLSPLDWALIESWKNAGVPLEAVLRGIDVAFEKWRGRKVKTQKVNSLAFCAQAVLTEAQQAAAGSAARPSASSPYTADELRAYLSTNAELLRKKGVEAYGEIAAALDRLSEEMDEHARDLEGLEQHLTVLEEKMLAAARAAQTEEEMLQVRRELDAELRPYRSKMSGPQLAMLEKQYLERRLLERQGLPRLSLFYLR